MSISIAALVFIAASAIVALYSGRMLGFREDTSCAVGGLIGFVIVNIALHLRRRTRAQQIARVKPAIAAVQVMAYFVLAAVLFSFIGWLTGWLHYHGARAGAMAGAVGGLMLAVLIPQFHDVPYHRLSWWQFILAVLVLSALLARVVWIMYFTEMRYWHEFS